MTSCQIKKKTTSRCKTTVLADSKRKDKTLTSPCLTLTLLCQPRTEIPYFRNSNLKLQQDKAHTCHGTKGQMKSYSHRSPATYNPAPYEEKNLGRFYHFK